MSSHRPLKITIRNDTTVAVYRNQHGICHGSWAIRPPESIPAGSTAEFECAFRSDCKFQIQYGFLCRSTEYILAVVASTRPHVKAVSILHQIHYGKPQLGIPPGAMPSSDNSQAMSQGFVRKDTSSKSAIVDASTILESHVEANDLACTVHLKETVEGSRYLEDARCELHEQYVTKLNAWQDSLESPICEPVDNLRMLTVEEFDNDRDDDVQGNASLEAAAIALGKLPQHLLTRLLMANLNSVLAHSFTWRVCNTRWEETLRGYKQSTFVRLVNLTPYTLLARTARTVAEDCVFVEYPCNVLSPSSATDFGVSVEYISMGGNRYRGLVCYAIKDIEQRKAVASLEFSFECSPTPGGGCRVKADQRLKYLKPGGEHLAYINFHVTTEQLNEAVVIWRIVDASQPSYLQIVGAWAIPEIPAKRGGARPHVGQLRFPHRMVDYRRQIMRDGRDILSRVIAHQAAQVEEDSTETSLRLDSLRFGMYEDPAVDSTIIINNSNFWWLGFKLPTIAFFKRLSIPSVRSLFTELRLPTDRQRGLLLRWKIGPEIFTQAFEMFDPVKLDTCQPGGLPSAAEISASQPGIDPAAQSVLLSAEIADVSRWLSPLLLPRLEEFQVKLVTGQLVRTPKFNAVIKSRLLNDHERQRVSLSFILLTAFAREVGSWMCNKVPPLRDPGTKRSFEEWMALVSPPSHCVWRVTGSDSTVDCQAILFIMQSRWDEGLSAVFPEGIHLLQPLQHLSSHWSSQTFDQITDTIVDEALRSAVVILQRLNATVTARELLRMRDAVNGPSSSLPSVAVFSTEGWSAESIESELMVTAGKNLSATASQESSLSSRL